MNRIQKTTAKLIFGLMLALGMMLFIPQLVLAQVPVDLVLGGSGAASWNIDPVMPGSSGSETLELRNVGTEEGALSIWISNIVSNEGDNPEPEAGDVSEPGELASNLLFNCVCSRLSTNISLPETLNNFPQSASDSRYVRVTPLESGGMVDFVWEWELPDGTGNDVQGDNLSFTINYTLDEILSSTPVPVPPPGPMPLSHGTVIGHVFEDANGNGVKDSGESGLSGISVVITDSQNNSKTLSTDFAGDYYSLVIEGAVILDVDESTLPENYVQTAGNDPVTVNVSAGETVDAGYDGYQLQIPQLGLSKTAELIADSDEDGIAIPGDTILYTLILGNSGLAPAIGVNVTDAISAYTTIVAGSVQTDQGTIISEDPISLRIGDIDPGVAATISFRVTIDSSVPEGIVISNQAKAIATDGINASSDDPNTGIPDDSTLTQLASSPILYINKSGSPNPATAGSNITYIVTYENIGNAPAGNVIITDEIPQGTIFVSATNGGVEEDGTVRWNIGILEAGESGFAELTVLVNSDQENGSTVTNSSYGISSEETGLIDGSFVTVTVHSPVLHIDMIDLPDPVEAGENITYTINYGNTGSASASNVIITSEIPQGTVFISATKGGIEDAGTVTWNIGNLRPGENGSVELTVSLTLDLEDGSTIITETFMTHSDEPISASGTIAKTMVNVPPGAGGLSTWFVGLFLFVALLVGFGLFFLFYYRNGISGYVLSSTNGEPLEGCKVVLSNSAGKVASETVTKENGQYTFGRIRRGEYTLAASHQDHQAGNASTALIWVKALHKIKSDLMLE